MAARPSRKALREWLDVEGRSQAALAAAVGVTQQTISAIRRSSVPSKDLALLIEAATKIPWRGWFTARELQRWEKRLARARSLAAH